MGKNHIMFGTQSAFYFQYIAGIRQPNSSYSNNWKEIIIDPFTNCTLLDVYTIEASIDMLIGTVSVSVDLGSVGDKVWETLNVQIPSGSIGNVYFRRLALFDEYIDMKEWIIKESNVVIWKNMTLVHDDESVNGIMNATVLDQ